MNLPRAQMLAQDLMIFHGFTDWTFKFDRSVTRLGYCQHRIKTISLGKHATEANSEEQVINTLLHEISHALVGGQHGHDFVWRMKAKELGCSGERLGYITVKAPYKYKGECPNCPATFYRYKAPHNTRHWHKRCGPDTRIVWQAIK